MEITEAVASRLMKWAGWLGGIVVLIIAFFGFSLSFFYRDAKGAATEGKTQIDGAVADGKKKIETSVAQATKDIAETKGAVTALNSQVQQLQSQLTSFREANKEMEKLRSQLHGQTTDLTKLDLRVHTLETVPGPGEPGSLSFGRIGCGPNALAKGSAVAYCAQGSPPALFQRTADGNLKPVASISPVGFQDTSNTLRPACTTASRGTFYVEKGAANVTDKPLVCARKSDNTYDWIQLGME